MIGSRFRDTSAANDPARTTSSVFRWNRFPARASQWVTRLSEGATDVRGESVRGVRRGLRNPVRCACGMEPQAFLELDRACEELILELSLARTTPGRSASARAGDSARQRAAVLGTGTGHPVPRDRRSGGRTARTTPWPNTSRSHARSSRCSPRFAKPTSGPTRISRADPGKYGSEPPKRGGRVIGAGAAALSLALTACGADGTAMPTADTSVDAERHSPPAADSGYVDFDPCAAFTPPFLAERRWDARPPQPRIEHMSSGTPWKGCPYRRVERVHLPRADHRRRRLEQPCVTSSRPPWPRPSATPRHCAIRPGPDVPGGCAVNIEM